MLTFTIVLICLQASLIQNVFGQYYSYGGIGAPAMVSSTLATPLGIASPGYPYGFKLNCDAGYGGYGVGNLAAMGELPVTGTSVIAGHIPIIGIVEFGGTAPAIGYVSMASSCGCGCNSPYVY